MALTDTLARLGSLVQRGREPQGQFQGLVMGGEGEKLLKGLFPGSQTVPPKRNTRDYLVAYSTLPWLRAVVGKISWSIAAVPWELYAVKSKRTGKYVKLPELSRLLRTGDHVGRRKALRALREDGELQAIAANPMLEVMTAANPYQTGFQMRQVTQAHKELVGEAFYLKERSKLGVPVALWPVPPNWVMSTPTVEHRMFRVSYRGWQGEIPDTEILWESIPDPENPYARGSGPAMALGDELQTDEYAAKHLNQWFYNRARPDLIVTAEGLDPNETKRMEQDWLNRHQGFWRAFKPYFFGRKVEVHEIDQDFRSQQLVQLRQHERDMVIQGWGVPPEVLGIIENSNRATIDASDYLYGKHVLVPRLEFTRAIFQERLVPEYDDRLILDYVSPVEEDRQFMLAQMQAAPYAVEINEWRAAMGKEPWPGAEGTIKMVPTTVKPVTSLADEAERAAQPPPDPFGLTPPGAGDGKKPAGSTEPATEEGDAAGSTAPTDDAKGLRAKAAREKGALDRLAARLEPKLREAFLAAVTATQAAVDLEALALALETAGAGAAEVALKLAELEQALGRLRPVITQAFTRAAEIAVEQLGQVGATVTFDAANPRAAAWAADHAANLVVEITDAQRQAIRALIQRAQLAEGETWESVARQLRDVVGLTERQAQAVARFRAELVSDGVGAKKVDQRAAKYAAAQLAARAETIARTEIQTATYQGQLEAWQQGMEQGELDPARTSRVWLVRDDDRLDTEVCEPMDEQRRAWDKPFRTGDGRSLMMPPAHPRCRCAVVLDFAS